MAAEETIVQVKNLVTSFTTEGRTVRAVNDVSFDIPKGKTLGIVGESGCGKSVTSLSIMRLIPTPPGKIEKGEILFKEKDLVQISKSDMHEIRGDRISMIFQEPMTALNPVYKIGDQVGEVFKFHRNMTDSEAWQKSIDMLRDVGIPAPERRVNEYPHQLSGGMRQRVMIAMALACEPDLLIADEPTTALDVTIQMQILQLMRDLQKKNGMSILFITHDLGVVAEMCDEVVVMYAGRVVEKAPVDELFKNPQHPYTKGLLGSLVSIDSVRGEPLPTIDGSVPSLFNMPMGCAFQDRCNKVKEHCRGQIPSLSGNDNHFTACFEVQS